MKTVLIVDDDEDIAAGLEHTIPWENMGIQSILTASNGFEALELIHENEVSILITDIKMPGMDGIALLREIQREGRSIHTIILSGYAEFEYARAALMYGVSGYALKPVKVEELVDLIFSLSIVNDQSGKEEDTQLASEAMERDLYEIIANRTGKLTDEKGHFLSEYRMLVVMKIKTMDGISNQLNRKVCEKIRKICDTSLLVRMDSDTLVIVSRELKTEKEWKCLLTGPMMELECDTGCQIIAGLGRALTSLSDMPESFLTLCHLMEFSFYHDSKKFYSEGQDVLPEQAESLEKVLYRIQAVDLAQGIAPVIDILSTLEEKGIYQQIEVKSVMTTIVNMMQRYCVKRQIFDKLVQPYRDVLVEIEVMWNMEQILNSIHFFYQQIVNVENSENSVTKTRLVQKIKEYVHMNYSADVNLAEASRIVRRNANYISHIFKEINGESFTEYVSGVRMEKAKQLLKKTDDTLYCIARKVGCNDEKYFVRLFKKHEGITPTQYRNR